MALGRMAAQVASGALLMNSVPHTVNGVSGRRFPSPFAVPPGRGLSTPLENVAWGGLNAIGGLLLLRSGATRGEQVAAVFGAAAMAVGLASWFGGVLQAEEAARPSPE